MAGCIFMLVAATDVVPSTGGGAMPLTPGNFEIENAALTTDGKAVVYSSNRDNIDRRHLWRVNLEGSSLVRLTAGGGIEWGPAPLTNGRIAILHADAKMPARVALLDDALTIRDLVPSAIPSGFPADALIAPQPVIFQASDGVSIHSQLFVPANGGAGKHPAVIFFHGGSRRQMLLGWHYMEYYHQAYGFNQYLASKGYIVLSVNYRSGIGYGTDFREAPDYGPTGASEYNDVMAAGAYLRSRADVDPARIGVWGGSYGGYLTALALARASNMFAAGVDIAGVHDWNLEIRAGIAGRGLCAHGVRILTAGACIDVAFADAVDSGRRRSQRGLQEQRDVWPRRCAAGRTFRAADFAG